MNIFMNWTYDVFQEYFVGGFLNLFVALGTISIYLSTILASLIVTYEALYEKNVDELLISHKIKQDLVYVNKREWWRLRNMNIWLRLLIYTIVSYHVILIYEILMKYSFVSTYLSPTPLQILEFNDVFEFYLRIMIFICLLTALSLDYFVSKTIKKSQK